MSKKEIKDVIARIVLTLALLWACLMPILKLLIIWNGGVIVWAYSYLPPEEWGQETFLSNFVICFVTLLAAVVIIKPVVIKQDE